MMSLLLTEISILHKLQIQNHKLQKSSRSYAISPMCKRTRTTLIKNSLNQNQSIFNFQCQTLITITSTFHQVVIRIYKKIIGNNGGKICF